VQIRRVNREAANGHCFGSFDEIAIIKVGLIIDTVSLVDEAATLVSPVESESLRIAEIV
jgi:hypothetical protein